jgi:hypothetical protein
MGGIKMSVDTKGRLLGKISHEWVLNFIKQKYDKNAESFVKLEDYGSDKEREWIKERYDNSGKWLIWSGFINFNDGKDDRGLFYRYTNHNSYESLEYYSKRGLEDMVKAETTYISLGCSGNSVDIIKALVTEFGGWIDENDCDDSEYYPIVKNIDGTIKPVFHVTMNDIYEKFGGVVIIEK